MEFLGTTIKDDDYEKLGKMIAIETQIQKISSQADDLTFSDRADLIINKLNNIEVIIKAALPLIEEFREAQT